MGYNETMRKKHGIFMYAVFMEITGISIFPLISHAFLPAELRALHEESAQRVEERREKFRQDILEKRKEFLNEWHEKKQGIKEKIKKENERLKLEFEFRRGGTKEEIGPVASSTEAEIPESDLWPKRDFLTLFQKSAKDIAHVFSPFTDLFQSSERQ